MNATRAGDENHLLWGLVRGAQALLRCAAFDVGAYGHPGGIGDMREEVFRDFLDRFLPPRWGMKKARIIDSRGGVTPEMDIVVYREDWAVRFLVSNDPSLLPVESVLHVIEFKSSLKSGGLEQVRRSLRQLDGLTPVWRNSDGTDVAEVDVVDPRGRVGYSVVALYGDSLKRLGERFPWFRGLALSIRGDDEKMELLNAHGADEIEYLVGPGAGVYFLLALTARLLATDADLDGRVPALDEYWFGGVKGFADAESELGLHGIIQRPQSGREL